ncbi:hypothetical protein PLESTB_001584400 [Pleodorina starrii]|uniref:C3H1-type domain-containing protein n=1 Tax=Pleodorina starrii TaxID=330485 RepID=A0A9W6F930_9CHLO|nr:hypothetical protein PLESTM_000586000 [Pleodorina starrii]GLC60196.1 hypothetical protein PLESTB_001584400 [Pleodorina starrii]GLC65957.1 hypothetical protein PLESTF_000366500 [Pleodorina starrii]
MEERPAGVSQDGMYGSRRSRLQKMEHKLSAHMDSEDRRVKELTEGILYDFLPAALNVMLPRCEDPLQELDADRCRAVASAALAVSALMNAPPGFLEFLLCVPWRKLSQLYPKTPNLAARSDSIDKLVSNLQVTDEERRKLVNTRIDPALMGTVLDFLYKDKHADSVPPMLQLTPVNTLQPDDKSAPLVVRETVAAVLDGATPLHCAALRGNPAQVDHLLYCGADPTLKTAAGELPIEQVPVCGDRASAPGAGTGATAAAAQRYCRCMGQHDQEVWECRSRLARSLIARRCFFSFGVGLFSWLRLVVFCLLCLLGQAGCYTSIIRPVVERHIDTRRQQKVAAARARAHALVTRMRSEADAGLRHLELAKRECMESAAFQRGPPDISQMCFTDPNKSPPPPPPPPISQIHDINFHLQESGTSSTGEELASEKAFKCFVRSVHALQSLDLHGDTVPQVFAELVQAGAAESRETHVLEDEQAELYSCWAESVLLKFRGCTCPGCAALAIQAVRMAHIQATRLFGKVDRVKQSHAERWRAVGQALARVVYVHICLLLETEAQTSPTRSLVWRAEQCLREWDRLEKAGLTQGAGVLDPRHVAALQLWAKTADSDLYLAEALHGQSMPPTKTLQEVVQGAISYSAVNHSPILARPVSTEVVTSLEQAITLASLPSPMLARIVRGVVASAVAELAAAARLREFVGARGAAALGGAGSGTSEAVAALTEALHAAEPFRSRLGPELDAAQELHSRWTQRAQALEKLEGAVEEVRSYTAVHPLSFSLAGAVAAAAALAAASESTAGGPSEAEAHRPGPGPGSLRAAVAAATAGSGDGKSEASGHAAAQAAASVGDEDGGVSASSSSAAGGIVAAASGEASQAPDLAEWDRRMRQLEAAMNDAKDANISVTKAKRLLKEMAAVAAAAEAARQLEAVMARRPSGPLQLKLALNKAEAAASTLSGLGGAPVPGLADVLGPLMAAARRRLDTERAAEALSKAAASYRTLADLARLEAAIYNAKKIGAEELDPESYRTSLELRAHLQEAARMRTTLETALRNLQNQLRPEDAEALERALQDAVRWEDLLAADVAKARKALEHWRAMTVSDAKLARLLREGTSTGVLARAIQEAAASGVKVQQAKRVLKLMQALETVLAGGGVDGGAAERHAAVKAKLDTAEQGGVTGGPLPDAARRMLARLAAQIARESLEAALKQHSERSVAQRISALREALEKAEGVLAAAAKEQQLQQQQQQKQAGGGEEEAAPAAPAAGSADRGGGKRESGSPQAQPQQQQQQAPKLANGSVVGKTSRGKRSSGGSIACGGGEAQAGPQDDAAASSSEPSSTLASSSSGSSSAATSSSGGSSSSSGYGAGCSGSPGPDDEVVTAVRELARKARQVLEEDQAEMARIERERQEAERARKEAQERERQERQRQEQERQKREKAEAAERERILAEKRERAKAEKNRQQQQQHHHNHHQQQQQQHKGKAAAAAAAAGGPTEPAVAHTAGADKGGSGAAKPSASSKAGGKGAGSQSGASGAAAVGRSATAPVTVSAVAVAAGKAAMPRDPQVPPPAAPGAASHQSAQPQVSAAPGTPVAPAALAPAAAAASPTSAAVLSPVAPALLQPTRAGSAVAQELFPTQLLSAADAIIGRALPQPPSAMAAVHTRGDSLESLSEVVHSLNKEVIEALDMDHDVMLPCAYSPLGAGAVTSAPSGAGVGGSVARTASSITAAADSTQDPSPSQRTSSIMSSIASADDVMLQSAAAGSCLVAGVGAGGVIGGAGSLSTISAGLQTGASSANSDVTPSLPPPPSAVAGAAASDAGAGGSSNGGGLAAKPRFGFVDLGGASWGLDSPILSGSAVGPGSLFTSLQPAMGDFGAMLGAPKPDAGCGWPAGPLGAAAAATAPGVLMFGGQGLTSGPVDDVGALLGPPVVSGRHTLGGGGGGALHNHVPDAPLPGLVAVHASPRTTVATASAGVHGIVQVRPLGAGGMPGTGPSLVQLAPAGMATSVGVAAGSGGGAGGTGRPSLHLQPGQLGQQPTGGGAAAAAAGLVARSGFWTPPSFQAAVDLAVDGGSAGSGAGGGSLASSLQSGGGLSLHHLGLSSTPAGAGLQGLDWPPQQQHQADSGLQLVHLGTSTSAGGLAPPGGGGSMGGGGRAGAIAVASRICRFFLQGYCRDGERCRYAHHGAAGASPSAQGGSAQLMQLSSGSPPPPLPHPHQQQHQQHLLGQVGVGGVGHSCAVGSFAFGVPCAEAFAPLGGGGVGGVSRTSTGTGFAMHGGEPLTTEQLLASRGSAPQLRHGAMMVGAAGGGAAGGGLPGCLSPGLVLLDRSGLGSQSLPAGGLAAAGGAGGAGVRGAHQQPVQLRDSATGATFAAVLTIPGTPTGGAAGGGFQSQPQQQSAVGQQPHQQQALLLSLPDDLSYSPS